VVKGQHQNSLTRNISKTVIDTKLDARKHLYVGPTGFRLVPSDLTMDDPKGSNIKVILFTWNISRTARGTMLDPMEII